jgi:hypothetical protein
VSVEVLDALLDHGSLPRAINEGLRHPEGDESRPRVNRRLPSLASIEADTVADPLELVDVGVVRGLSPVDHGVSLAPVFVGFEPFL